MSLRVAEAMAGQLRAKPDSTLGLPAGRTPLGCYRVLSEWSRLGKLDWSSAKCFGLDEYVDVADDMSFAHYLNSNLYVHTNLPVERRFNPLAVDDYESLILSEGGLDLIVVGIGRNGHIAFNEPGTPRLSWTHCTWLTESTRQANAAIFGSSDKVPITALTMGLQTILNARRVVLVASGEQKHSILNLALSGEVTPDVPASFLQEHPNLEVFTDFQFQRSGRFANRPYG